MSYKDTEREVVIPRPLYCPNCGYEKGKEWRIFIDADDACCWLVMCPNCKEAFQIGVEKMSPSFPLSYLQGKIPPVLGEAELTRVLKQIKDKGKKL